MAKYCKNAQKSVERAMHEMKKGKLKSSRSGGKLVENSFLRDNYRVEIKDIATYLLSEPVSNLSLPDMTLDERHKLISISFVGDKIDRKAASFTPQSLEATIALIISGLIDMRKKANQFGNRRPREVFKDITLRASAAHQLLCAVNDAEDAKAFVSYLSQAINPQTLRKDNIEALNFLSFFFNKLAQNQTLNSKLYVIDLWRRIGQDANNPAFWEKGFQDFQHVKGELLNAVNDFTDRNTQPETSHWLSKVPLLAGKKQLPEEESKRIGIITKACHLKDPSVLNPIFYENVCQSFSQLLLHDFENLNFARLEKSITLIDPAQKS